MTEIWRDVVGFESHFQVSNLGRLLSKRTNKMLKQGTSKSGYKVISTRVGGRAGKCYCLKVHRLVAEAFLASPSEAIIAKCATEHYGKVIVRHLDNDKENNSAGNLAWGSSQDNTDDFKKTPAFSVHVKRLKEHPPTGKAAVELRDYIKSRYQAGSKTDGARALAKELGIHHTNIARIAGNRAYKDAP